MLNDSFMFSVEMLADMLGGNRQYLSKKIKTMMDDPTIKLQAVLKSKKDGYQISEEEVLRCFNKLTPRKLREYKERYLGIESAPKVKMLTRKEETPKYMKEENDMLIEWKIRLASASRDERNTPEMRKYLEDEMEKIKSLKEEKRKEYYRLEIIIGTCDKMIEEIERELSEEEE